MQTQVPPQGLYMNPAQPSFSPSGLLPHSELQEIDKQLSSGWWSCYNCWTYVIAIGAILTLVQSIMVVFSHPIFILNIVDAIIEAMFAFVMQEVIKNKKIADAKGVWCLAYTCTTFVIVVNALQANTWITQFGAPAFYGGMAGLFVYYCLVYLFPAYQIRSLILRRQAALRNASQYSA